jgi:hypothetical protein
MRRWAKWTIAGGLVLVGGFIGSVGTFLYVTPTLLEANERSSLLWLQSEAYARYRLSEYTSARRALLLHAQGAEGRAEGASADRRRDLASQAGLAYARLAVLAERAGMGDDQREFYARSLAQYSSMGDRVTPKELRELVISYDRSWDSDFKDVQ